MIPALKSTCIRYPHLVCLVLMVWLGTDGAAVAGETSLELWPEVDLWLRLSPAWRLSMFVPLSRNIETGYREGSLILQADYAWGSAWPGRPLLETRLVDEDRRQKMNPFMVRGGYLYGQSLDDHGQQYLEDTILFELHGRAPLKSRVLLSNRLRTDLRWLGDDHVFSTRLRYRLMVEKEFEVGRTSFVPYASVEPYYDSRYGMVNRVRLIGGTSVAWSPRFALEGNITYQYDSRMSVTNLLALNVILHFYFDMGGGQ